MQFKVVENKSEILVDTNQEGVYLIHTTWDDWFQYNTTYQVWIKIEGVLHFIGTTKIGSTDMGKGVPTAPLDEVFQELPQNYFSLGTDEAFYIELNTTKIKDYRERVLTSMRDISFDDLSYKTAKTTDVFKVSLVRDISTSSIVGRFRRLARGDIKLSNYHFTYNLSDTEKLEFKVEHGVFPPSNIHTIIGRNGVGKSHVLTKMIGSIVNSEPTFKFDTSYAENYFSNIVSVNFSTFENKPILENVDGNEQGYSYYHLSSKSESKSNYEFMNSNNETIKPNNLESLFIESLKSCFLKKPKRWRESISFLYSDPVFRDIGVSDIYNNYMEGSSDSEFIQTSYNLFNKLSSGHKIVLLTLTKLVELSEEKTLIIMDEPEMHLHPPLLGSFIRSLSYLLNYVNGVAILATHSPIILQETKRDCVYKLSRNGNFQSADRPNIETFGENVGILTSEVFGLEVTNSGYHNLIKEVVSMGLSFEESLEKLNQSIGTEAYSLLLSLVAKRNSNIGGDV